MDIQVQGEWDQVVSIASILHHIFTIDAGMRRVIKMNMKKVREIVKKRGVDIRVGRKQERGHDPRLPDD
jgi:hypothetical protein